MEYEGNIVRRKFVDVRIVRSKTGHAILRGGTFYNWTLHRHLRQLSKDVIGEINSINYRMRLVSKQSARRMKRSEQLVKTYDLPPLKPKQVVVSPSGNYAKKNTDSNNSKQVESVEIRKGNNHILSLRTDMRSASPNDGKELRRMFFSPAPCPQKEYDDENEDNIITLSNEQSNIYPHIKVENCEEKLPPLNKSRQNAPEYAQKKPERTVSSNSLEVPSPMQKRRNQDGKCITILTSHLQPGYSLSASSILDVVQNDIDEDEKGLHSILKPLTITCGNTRTTSRSQANNHLTAKRNISRSLSPRPRLTNRTQETPTLIIKGSNNLN